MPDRSIIRATERTAADYQEAAAREAAEARQFFIIDDRDFFSTIIRAQNNAALYAREARMRLSQLIGEA